ncbi:MAG TPA: hypothetical protein VG826_27125 [Pirellulales bacterium]|nr:hypothetical protein [Pirellulales bacterium]
MGSAVAIGVRTAARARCNTGEILSRVDDLAMGDVGIAWGHTCSFLSTIYVGTPQSPACPTRRMAPPSSPIYLAKEAQNMARNAASSDGLVFHKVATASTCMVAVLSGMQMLIWKSGDNCARRVGGGA